MAYVTDTQLAASSGASLIGYKRSEQGANIQTVETKLRERVSVKDFGALGIGQDIQLSPRYGTLAQAQVDYPFATSLSQSLDWAGIQAALNAVAYGGTVYIPAGRYILSNSVAIPSGVTIEGESRNATIIDNQNKQLNAPQFVNKDPTTFYKVTMRNLTGNGGTHFLKVNVSSDCSLNCFDGISTDLQTISVFEFNRLEVSRFNDCVLLGTGTGRRIDIQGFPNNANMLVNTRMTAAGAGALRFGDGVEVFLMLGGSIEAGGQAGKADITIATATISRQRSVHFEGVYFEAGNEFVLRCNDDATDISFDGCHFTGASQGSGNADFAPKFDTGKAIISFGSNDWSVATGALTVGPPNMLISGRNDRLVGSDSNIWSRKSPRSGQVTAKRRTFTASLTAFTALSFARPSSAAAQSNQQVLRGTLNVTMSGYTASAGLPRVLIAKYEVAIFAWQGQPLEVYWSGGPVIDGSSGEFAVALSANASGTTADLKISATGANGAGLSQLGFDFDYDGFSYLDAGDIVVSVP